MRSGNTYTANGAAEMIKEKVANIKTDDSETMFQMDSGYLDEEIIKTIESLGGKDLIKGKVYPTHASQVTDPSILFVRGDEGRETAELFTILNIWDKDRRFVVSRVLKSEKERTQFSHLEGDEYEYLFFVTSTECPQKKLMFRTKSVAMLRITSRKPNMIWRLDIFCINRLGQMRQCFK